MSGSARILIVAEGPAAALSERLEELGYTVCGTVPPGRAADEAAAKGPDVALIDLAGGAGSAGAEAAERIGGRPEAAVVCLVGADGAAAGDLLRRGRLRASFGFAVEPAGLPQLRLSIDSVLFQAARRRREDAASRRRVADLERRLTVTQTVFDAIDQAVFAADTRRRPLMVNVAARRVGVRLGLRLTDGAPSAADVARAYESYDVLQVDGRTPVDDGDRPLARALRGEPTDEVELKLRRRSEAGGGTRRISVRGRPLRDAGGDLIGGVIVISDVTRASQTEGRLRRVLEGLRARRRLTRTVLDTMQEAVVAVDTQGRRLLLNRAARSLARMTPAPSAPLDERLKEYGICYPDGVTPYPMDRMPIRRAMNGETFEGVELFFRNERVPDGRHLSASGGPMRSRSGALLGGVAVLRDVTEIRRHEVELQRTAAELHERAQLMETVFDSMSDGVVVADGEGRLTLVNKSAVRQFGFRPLDVPADRWTDRARTFHPDRVTRFDEADLPLARALRGEPSDDVEVFLRHPGAPDGLFVGVGGRPLRNEAGAVTGGLAVFRDLSHRRAAREAFTSGRLEAIEAVLHNVGNALNSVTVGVGTLYDALRSNELAGRLSALAEAAAPHRDDPVPWLRDDPQGRQAVPFFVALAADLAAQNARWLATVTRVRERVRHIVDVIRTERALATGPLEPKVVDLRRQIGDAVGALQELLARRGIGVEVDCGRAPEQVRMQESRFHQLLVNLVRNAMEATDERAAAGGFGAGETPRIRIAAYLDPDHLVVEVSDNGIGIDPRRLRSIFAAGYTTKPSGTGLGLHSAANFVNGVGGRITPLSDGPGRGATLRAAFRRSATLLEPPDPAEEA